MHGDFPGRGAASTLIQYDVEVSGEAPEDRLDALITEVDAIAEIPLSLRQATPGAAAPPAGPRLLTATQSGVTAAAGRALPDLSRRRVRPQTWSRGIVASRCWSVDRLVVLEGFEVADEVEVRGGRGQPDADPRAGSASHRGCCSEVRCASAQHESGSPSRIPTMSSPALRNSRPRSVEPDEPTPAKFVTRRLAGRRSR